MKRMACLGVVAVVFLMVTATHSQTYNPSRSGGSGGGSYSGGSGSGGGGGSFGGSAGTGMPEDFARDMAEEQRDFQQRMGRMQRQIEEMQRQAEETRNRAMQESLHATDAQWRQLKPKLDRIERLKIEAGVSVDLSSFGTSSGSGFQSSGMSFGGTWGGGGGSFGSGPQAPGRTQFGTWGAPARKSPMDMTPGEVLCDDLGRLLQDPGAPASEVAQKVASLRRIRTQAREDLSKARTELRAQIMLQQEPVLIAMGYLD